MSATAEPKKCQRRWVTSILCLLLAALSAGSAGGAEARSAHGARPDSDRRIGTLANGLSYFIERGPKGQGVRVSLVVRAGDAEALPGEQQVAHVVEHVVVGNLANVRSKGAIKERAERLGSTWGSDAGAYTGLDRTVYFLRIAPDRLTVLPEALDIVREWSDPDNMTDEAIDRERSIVIEEARRSSPAARHLIETQMRTWFKGHPKLDYARDPAGELSATPGTIRAFHRRWYRPRHMAVVVVGDVDPSAVVEALASRFWGVPPGPVEAGTKPLARQSLSAGHIVPVASSEGEESGLQLSFKYRAAPPRSAARAKQVAIARLAEHLFVPPFANLRDRIDTPIAGGGLGGSIGRVADTEILTVQLASRPGRARAALADGLGLLSAVRRHGFTMSEIERAHAALLEELGTGAPSLGAVASGWESQFVDGAPEPSSADIRAVLSSLTRGEVNRTLRAWLDPAHRDIFVIGMQSGPGQDISAKDLLALELRNATDFKALLSPVAIVRPEFAELPEAVEPQEPKQVEGGMLRWTLPKSGATLIFRKANGQDINLTLRRAGGLARFSPKDAQAASAAVSLVAASGLGGLDARLLGRFMSAQTLMVRPVVTAGREGIVGTSPAADWTDLLRLARAYLVSPQCDRQAYAQMAAEADRSAGGGDALVAATNAFYGKIASAMGQVAEPKAEDLAAVTPEALCKIYHDMLRDTAGMTIVVEGDMEADAAYLGVAAALDIAAATGSAAADRDNAGVMTASPVVETTGGRTVWRMSPTGAAAKVQLVLQTAEKSLDNVQAATDEEAAALVGDLLGGRLLQRLREGEGGTYSIGVRAFVADTPGRVILSAGFDCKPERVDLLVSAALEEIARLTVDGPTATETSAVRERWGSRLQRSETIAERWIRYGTLGAPKEPDNVTIRRWIARYLDPRHVHAYILLPTET